MTPRTSSAGGNLPTNFFHIFCIKVEVATNPLASWVTQSRRQLHIRGWPATKDVCRSGWIMQQKVSSQLCPNRMPGLDLNMTVESVLDALTTSFFPSGKGYGVLPIARNATSHVRETFNAYGSIDDIDKKRCSIALPLSYFAT